MKNSLTPGTTISHYRIVSNLGAGGMGEVYLAEDTQLNRKVAIKFLQVDSASDPSARKRLMREAQAAAGLDHPNICAIHEVGEEGDRSFIVMQFVDGETLAARLAAAPFEVAQVVNLGLQVASALSVAHSRGIVHRDIKPQNIMVTGNGQVKVLDFGLAKLPKTADMADSQIKTESFLTTPGLVVGTVPYMSPEQARGEELDAQTDVFSFGVVIYEAVTRQRPFGAKTAAEIISAILTREPFPLTKYSSDLPAELVYIVDRCLKKERSERYLSARELLTDLESLSRKLYHMPSTHYSSPSIAVLPFINMSADLENEYFCDGLAEELINVLTKIDRLSVVARTSAFSFKGKDTDVREIGRKLNVGAVLEGSVRKSGNRLRITAQLINVADGYHLWSERYDRQLEDIFDIQDEISLAIVDALKMKLLGEERAAVLKRYTENVEAHELYLKGRYFWFKFNPEGWKKSRDCFEQALQKDPNFALAYSGLSDALIGCAVFTSPKEIFPKPKELTLRALKLDPSIAEAWCSSAAVKFFHEWDWDGAESDCRQSIELNPNYIVVHDLYSLCLLARGKFDEAIRESSKTCELDPLSAYFNSSLGFALYYARRYDEAKEQLLKSVDLDPVNMWAHIWLIDLYEQRGLYAEALSHRQKLLTLSGNNELAIEIGQEFLRSGYQGLLMKYLDGLNKQSQLRYVPPLDFAATYVRLGDDEKALDWLEKAFEDRTMYLGLLKFRPTWDILHSNARYTNLLQRMGLSQ